MRKKSRSIRARLLLPMVVLLLAAAGGLAGYWYAVSRPSAPPPVAAVDAAPKLRREITLYFGAPEGTHLLPQPRDIEECTTDRDCLRSVMQALIEGPRGDLVPILPARTVLLDATADNGTAVLDFSRELLSAHPGGSMSELLTVYGVADSVAVNFPHIRQVRILVEGQTVESLKGHLGLQEAVQADFGYTRPPETIRPAEETAPAGGGQSPAGKREGREV